MLIQRFPTDPFRTMDFLFDAMLPRQRRAAKQGRTPDPSKLALEEMSDQFQLHAELPGISPDALELSLGDGWIEITATRETNPPEGYVALRRERSRHALSHRIELPHRIDADSVEAVLRDGVLTVTLPKHASVSPRQITIQAA